MLLLHDGAGPDLVAWRAMLRRHDNAGQASDSARSPEAGGRPRPGRGGGGVLTVTCLQMEPPPEADDQTLPTRVLGYLDGAAPADLVVLPELWDVGFYNFDRYSEVARPLSEGPLRVVAEWASTNRTTVVAGSILERDGDRLFNTSAVVGPDGTILGTYRKAHLFDRPPSREHELVACGDGPAVVETAVGRLGLAICYDLRFPEHFEHLAAAGADLFLVVAAWDASRLAQWRALVLARAVDHATPVVACNSRGSSGTTVHGGGSLIADAGADVVAEAGADDSSLRGTLDRATTAEWRSWRSAPSADLS